MSSFGQVKYFDTRVKSNPADSHEISSQIGKENILEKHKFTNITNRILLISEIEDHTFVLSCLCLGLVVIVLFIAAKGWKKQ